MVRELAGTRLRYLGSFTNAPPLFNLPEVAFAGRSNVGKSSCINALLGTRRAARISKRPGRTRTLNFYEVESKYILVDLPGYGYAQVSGSQQRSWKGMVDSYLLGQRPLKVLVILVDPRRQPGGMDAQLLAATRELGIAALLVATKTDKLKRRALLASTDALKLAYDLDESWFCAVSARTGRGIPELRKRILRLVFGSQS